MYDAFIKAGFIDVTRDVNRANGAGMQVGDILLNHVHHTEIYTSSGKVTGAHWDYDGKTGDSSGKEICTQNYYNYPWDCVLRFPDSITDNSLQYSLEEIVTALECINGVHGTGDKRRESVTIKGFDYDKVQALVNRIIGYVW